MKTTNDKINAVKMNAIRINQRTDIEWKDAVHWKITLNDSVTLEYSEGYGHFFNTNHFLYNKLAAEPFIKAVKNATPFPVSFGYAITPRETKELFKERVDWKTGKVTPPNIKDILYSLTIDSDANNYSFSDWCSNYGYSDDSIKAKETYEHCRETLFKLQKLGFSLEELQKYFENY